MAVSANKLELLQIADAVAREKSIDRGIVIAAMEDAIAKAARARYGSETDVHAEIDAKKGELRLSRHMLVVDVVENSSNQISLADAQRANPGAQVGDTIQLGGTPFQARGTLGKLPDAAVRGFRLGLTVLISTEGFATLSDFTSPLPGLGTYYRYKMLSPTHDAEQLRADLGKALGDSGWTIRTPRDALGPMVRYYDLFMRFLVIVGLASLLIGGVSVWTGISAYISERANVIAVMRSVGASQARIFLHFFAQVATLALIGVGIGLIIGASTGLLALPIVGQAIGVALPPALYGVPLLIAAAVGLVTAFAFSYLPLQQALNIQPIILFRSKGLASPQFEWRGLMTSVQVVPVILSAAAFVWLAIIMTDDPLLVAAFVAVSVAAVVVLRLATGIAIAGLRRLLEAANPVVRRALRGITGPDSNAPSVVISVGMALATLIVVLALQTNLSNEYLGASVFDVPTFVASDLFKDEAAKLKDVQIFHAGTKRDGSDIKTAGGRVLAVTALGTTLEAARARAYEAVSGIHFENCHYRSDIALDAVTANMSELL